MRHKILIWDIPVRLFHWLLVASIAYAWFSIEILEDMNQHFIAGYCVLTLIMFRLIWGFIGTYYARFTTFLFPLSELTSYFKSLRGKSKSSYLGHNPLGGLSVFAMLAILTLQALTGLFSTDDYFFGPLYGLVSNATSTAITEIHHLNSDVILVLIAIHILAILFYRVVKKERLVIAMFTGKKHAEENHQKSIEHSKVLLAAIIISICAASVYFVANTPIESEENPVEYDFY